jgi:hypothetical protein
MSPHTYGEVRTWGDDTRWELIDGEAHAMGHGVDQYWLVHPTDRVVTIHRRQGDAGFAPPDVFEARGVVGVVGYEGLAIDWDQAFAAVPRPD